jgi:hypothetical protein
MASGGFERALTEQASTVVIAPRIDSESRRGRDYVRVTLTMTVIAADVAQALDRAWQAFGAAAGPGGWDTVTVVAEVRCAGPLP